MKTTIFFAAAVTISITAQAQQAAPDSSKLLKEVTVETGVKFPVKQSQTGKVVTVISKAQLENSNGKTVAQVLNEQAGVVINGAYNAPGTVQTVYMRGAASGRALILLDGIPVSDPSMINNEFDLNLFSINEVERIEICKGAQSTLYGSDAIAGVINIITVKKDAGKAFNVKATAGFGNKNTTRNALQLFGKAGKLTYSTRFAQLKTDGFSAAYDSTGKGNFDADGYNGNVISAAVQYQATPEFLVKSFLLHSQYRAGIDAGVFADEKDYTIRNTSLSSGAGMQYQKGKVNIVANYQYGELTRHYLNDSLYVRPFGTKFENNQYGGRTQFAELYGNVKFTSWLTVIAGTDYRWANMHQHYFSLSSFGPYSSSFPDTALHQTAYFASLFFTALQQKAHLELGGRVNHHSKYGSNSTYTINPSYNINSHWRVIASVATGFKAPSIFQLLDVYSGNPALQPEKSTNYEVGVQQTHQHISTRAVYFNRIIKNGIDYDYVNFTYFNFVQQKVQGLELEMTAAPVKNLSITANYTLLTGEEKTQSRKNVHDTTYDYLLRRPRHTVNMTVGYDFGHHIYAGISGKSVSKRYDVGGYRKEDVLLDSYIIFSAYASWQYQQHLKFFIDAQNLTNKKFFDIRGYNSIPFMINGGISFNW